MLPLSGQIAGVAIGPEIGDQKASPHFDEDDSFPVQTAHDAAGHR
jgi:hypothetical protein